jgi:triacylglycerol lipase
MSQQRTSRRDAREGTLHEIGGPASVGRHGRASCGAAMAALVLVLAACSDDDPGTAATATTAAVSIDPSTAPTTTPDTITAESSTPETTEVPETSTPEMAEAPETTQAADDPSPELTVDPADAAAAVQCTEASGATGDAPAVLLVHGTGSSPEDSFGPGLSVGLAASGLAAEVCTVSLPERAVGDIQVSAEYAVVAIRTVAERTGRPVAVVAHSQGVLVSKWAMSHWPDVAADISMLVAIAGPNLGAPVVDGLCAAGCAASLQQMRPASAFLAALAESWSTVSVPVTAIRSLTDEFVPPDSAAALDGAQVITVQDVCADRATTHAGLLADTVVFAAIGSALQHEGSAVATDLGVDLCSSATVEGFDAAALAAAGDAAFAAVLTAATVMEEPALAPYV